ncbi:damage-inducible protein DinB [Flavobacterium magnum]|uniref:Damage-inducible protein DinB n=1 Tax=Flavobacterium magnum TaxID=2162713 RepID=A0A2S0RJ12_9FLAO|nr:DinB family protein [Flavobacterium magnum]AWA31529.1 damage-inducible protein DinB [Flavobacterium magnum]
MKSLTRYSKEQYELVKDSRNVLFDYCKTISAEDFINQNSSFGRGGSMRNLLVHIANTYQYWIANVSLRKNIAYDEYETVKNISDTIMLFNVVDEFMSDFFERMDSLTEIQYEISGVKKVSDSFKIFTHVITHEFHHKGQVLSISRHLGYVPIDTDIMR